MSQLTPSPALAEPPSRQSPLRIALQIIGGAIGLGLFAWVIMNVAKPENRALLEKLKDAAPGDVALLLGLSVISVSISGSVFRQALTPVRILPMLEVQATNAIASLLALLPFKLSIVFRVLVHNRRDGVPLLTIGAWFASVAATMACVLAPVIAVSVWRGKVDSLWIIASLLGVALCAGLMVLISRLLRTDSGWRVVERLWGALPMPGALRQSSILDRAHEGVRMLSSLPAVGSCVGLRLTDIGVQAARFVVAAGLLGQALAWDQAVLAGSTFFLIGALAPSGQLGAREAGTAGVMHALLASMDFAKLSVVVLTISVMETLVLLVLAAIGVLILRPASLFKARSTPT